MMALGGLPAQFVKAETEYRRERLTAQWGRSGRPRVPVRPTGSWLHRFGFRLGSAAPVECGLPSGH